MSLMVTTKHHDVVNKLQYAEQYLIILSQLMLLHKHNHSGSCALKYVWHTKNLRRQQAGLLEFCFTNDFLLPHCSIVFKWTTVDTLTMYQSITLCEIRNFNFSKAGYAPLNTMSKLPNSHSCFYCCIVIQ